MISLDRSMNPFEFFFVLYALTKSNELGISTHIFNWVCASKGSNCAEVGCSAGKMARKRPSFQQFILDQRFHRLSQHKP